MITGKLMTVAESVVRDIDTNLISILNIIDELTAEGFPLFVNRLSVLATIQRTDDEAPARQFLMKVTIGELELARTAISVGFLDGTRANLLVRLQGLVIPVPGSVTFTVYDATPIESNTVNAPPNERKIIDTYFLAKARQPLSVATSSVPPSLP